MVELVVVEDVVVLEVVVLPVEVELVLEVLLAGGFTVNDNTFVAVQSPVSVELAVTVTVYVPAVPVAGVPDIELLEQVSPLGQDGDTPILHE